MTNNPQIVHLMTDQELEKFRNIFQAQNQNFEDGNYMIVLVKQLFGALMAAFIFYLMMDKQIVINSNLPGSVNKWEK